jgi:multidrug efflux pump subunit AcrA (membrane-fusion protein)
MKLVYSLFLPTLLFVDSFGREITIKARTLETNLELDATFIPKQPLTFKIEPDQWSEFIIADLVKHGASVKKDQVIIAFEAENYQRHLAETKEGAKVRAITLARAERQLGDLKTNTPRLLEGLKLAHDRAKESLDYFTLTGKALQEEEAIESLKRSKRSLSYQEEELKQLLKMYKEDGITEETEEIILKRQRASVKSAEFSVKKAELSSKWALEKTIPRQAVDLERAFADALLAYETGIINLPRDLEEATLAFTKIQRSHTKLDQDQQELIDDGALMNLKAPADGTIYHGKIDEHSWSVDGTLKYLFKAGSVPANTVFMSFIPNTSTLTLQGAISQKDVLKLPTKATGTALVEGLGETTFPVAVTRIDVAPDSSGRYGLGLSIELPKDSPIVTGMKGKVRLITYRKENAISIPPNALTRDSGKSTVKLKMADGNHETREVKTGRSVNGNIEILEGLEVDQVILVPEDAEPLTKDSTE